MTYMYVYVCVDIYMYIYVYYMYMSIDIIGSVVCRVWPQSVVATWVLSCPRACALQGSGL